MLEKSTVNLIFKLMYSDLQPHIWDLKFPQIFHGRNIYITNPLSGTFPKKDCKDTYNVEKYKAAVLFPLETKASGLFELKANEVITKSCFLYY